MVWRRSWTLPDADVPDADRGGVHQSEEQRKSKYGRQNGHDGPISTQFSGSLEIFVPETGHPWVDAGLQESGCACTCIPTLGALRAGHTEARSGLQVARWDQ